MIFGDASVFAIQIDSVFKHSESLFGEFHLWIGGNKIGNGLGGSDILFILESVLDPLLQSSTSLQAAVKFEERSAIIDELIRIQFAESLDYDEREYLLAHLRRYIVPSAYDTEGFDRYFIVVLRDKTESCRIIWREKGSGETKEHTVRESAYQNALVECYDWASKQARVPLDKLHWIKMSHQEKEDVLRNLCKCDPTLLKLENEEKLLNAAIKAAFSPHGKEHS